MKYVVEPSRRDGDPCWSVYRVTDVGRELIERHFGDDCDANERRYARERAGTLARTLAARDGVGVVYAKQ